MSTPAEILNSLSDIDSGTPAEHLLAITTGSGPGTTILVDVIHAELAADLDTELTAEVETAAVDSIDATVDTGETDADAGAEILGELD